MVNQLILRRRAIGSKDKRPNYLKFTAQEDECTIALNKVGSPNDYPTEYSLNKGAFLPYTYGTTISLDEGDYVEWRRAEGYEGTMFSKNYDNYYQFTTNGRIIGSGFITSLLQDDGLVTSTYNYAFARLIVNTIGLTFNLNIPDTIVTLGAQTFSYSDGYTGSIYIPDSVTTMGERVFYHDSGFNGNVRLHDGITSMDKEIFDGCSGLVGEIHIPNRLTAIKKATFGNCSGLTGEISIPSGVTSIGESAFSGCSGFTSLTIPNTVTSIYNGAFNSCSGLTGTITIPRGCSIGNDAFVGCSNLTNIYSYSDVSISQFYNSGDSEGIFFVDGNVIKNQNKLIKFKDIIITGNFSSTTAGTLCTGKKFKSIRVSGNYSSVSGSIYSSFAAGVSQPTFEFCEINGDVILSNSYLLYQTPNQSCVNGFIFHLGYNGVISASPANIVYNSADRISKIYVGDGSSQAADQAVLDLYLADADWSQLSDKLDLWWNYNGEYKN